MEKEFMINGGIWKSHTERFPPFWMFPHTPVPRKAFRPPSDKSNVAFGRENEGETVRFAHGHGELLLRYRPPVKQPQTNTTDQIQGRQQ